MSTAYTVPHCVTVNYHIGTLVRKNEGQYGQQLRAIPVNSVASEPVGENPKDVNKNDDLYAFFELQGPGCCVETREDINRFYINRLWVEHRSFLCERVYRVRV